MEETLDQISPILPIDFFRIDLDLYFYAGSFKKKHELPHFSDLLFEDPFAKVFMGYEGEGLHFEVEVYKKFEESFFPKYRSGDSLELFIDTRDLKSSGFLTKFCHHFVFLPVEVDGFKGQEVTTFRTDDQHELCDPSKLQIHSEFKRKGYLLRIFIPSECLEGYDPENFHRLGFAFRINRPGNDPQHLTLSSDYWAIESQPSLWTSFHMRKK